MSLVGLLLRLQLVRRRSLAAWAVYLTVLAVLNAGPTGPVQGSFAMTGAALLAVSTWLVMAGTVCDQATTSMLAAVAGGPRRLHLLQAVSGLLAAVPLVVLAPIWDVLAADQPELGPALLLGVLSHLTAALVGAGIGTLASRPVTRDDAVALLVGAGGCLLALGVEGSSPFWPVFAALADGSARVTTAAVACLGAVAWATVLTALAGAVAGRRRSYGARARS
ncbi:MAG: hypothetical protein GXX79_19205 [Actinomycetales bacterium]|nr:hypothetical protein [Actinomycetales bacterium]